MSFRSLKLFLAAVVSAALLLACGGESAPAPLTVSAKSTESSVTLTWAMEPGVEYWLFYGPQNLVPSSTASMHNWIGVPGGNSVINVKSPYVVTGLSNGTVYAFSINGRSNGGPGGPGSTPVFGAPRLAGANWQLGPNNPLGSNDLLAVTYGSLYVAAGNNGALYSSSDGLTWSTQKSGTPNKLNGASFFGNYRVVGDGGLILSSVDGTTWTAQTSGTTQHLYAIASNFFNLVVAVGANGTILTSSDGVNWTAAASPTSNHLYAVQFSIYDGGTWIAVGAGGTLLKSTDGVTWGVSPSGTAVDLTAVAFGGADSTVNRADRFVVVGNSGTLLNSLDGVTWTQASLPVAFDFKSVVFGRRFIAAGSGGNILLSDDGVNWVASAATGTSNTLYSVVRGFSTYSAVGAGGVNVLSE